MTTGHTQNHEPCPSWLTRLEPFVDGELPVGEAGAVRDHLRGCSACLAEAQVLADLNQTVRALKVGVHAPATLWPRIQAMSMRPSRTQAADAVHSVASVVVSRRSALATVAGLVVAAAAAASYGMLQAGTSVVTASVNDFITYRARGWTVDHAARDAGSLAAWAQARVAFAVPDLREQFGVFEASGVRLCWLLNRRLLGVTYASGDDRAVVYVMETQGLPLPSADRILPNGARGSIHYAKGHGVAVWTQKDLVFVLVASEQDFARALPHAVERGDAVDRSLHPRRRDTS